MSELKAVLGAHRWAETATTLCSCGHSRQGVPGVSALDSWLEHVVGEIVRGARLVPEEDLVAAHVEQDRLREVLRGAVGHLYNGECPDETQPDARDQQCPACLLLPSPVGASREDARSAP